MASAVLFSGGLDSAVLLARELRSGGPVQPIHVRAGLAWEDAEARAVRRVLAAPVFAEKVSSAVTLTIDMRDVYPSTHWAVRGEPPGYNTPDDDVFLEGRNIVLISKAAVLCARLGLERLVLGPLAGNPFPDATPEFFETMGRALSLGLARPFSVAAPLAHLHKEDVIRLGLELQVPLELTLSCMNPTGDLHCGRCSKCRERHDAFHAAGIEDPTAYATPPGTGTGHQVRH
jgi:7-cyano-7-deazaguanine synthase